MFSTIKNINTIALPALENADKDIALYSTGV
jgi:hypothetical protein